jgi:protein-glutamine gamma-glutamyltransferase
MSVATPSLGPPPPGARRLVAPRVARAAGLGLLAAWGATRWSRLVDPAAPVALATMLAAAVGWAVALDRAPAGRGRALAAGLGSLALLAAVLLAAGAPVGLVLEPGGWRVLGAGIRQGLEALPGSSTPYAGADPWARTVVLVGGGILLAWGALGWVRLPADAPLSGRVRAAVPLVLLAALPTALRADRAGVAQGVAIFTGLALALWLEELRRDTVRMAGALAAGAAVLGLAGGAALNPARPWIDARHLTEPLQPSHVATFAWTHGYGPLDWPRTGREVLRVRMDRPVRLKAENLDGFDGMRWRPTPAHGIAGPRSELPAGVPSGRFTETLRVTVRDLVSEHMIGAGAILGVSRTPVDLRPVTPGGSPGTLVPRRPLRPGDAYRATVYAADPSTSALARAGTRYPPWTEAYRILGLGSVLAVLPAFGSPGPPRIIVRGAHLPGRGAVLRSPYGRVYTLARRLTAGAPTPAAAVARIQAFLGRGFRYDEHVHAGRRPLVRFLLRDRRGYCQHFSGAMALLLRMAGIPARVSAGFTSGTRDDARGEWVVRDFDAHSWVEAWFPGTGWVTFDPTPAAAPALGSRRAGSAPLTGDRGSLRLADRPARPTHSPGGSSPDRLWLLAALAALALVAGGALARRRLPLRRRDPVAEIDAALRRSGPPHGLTLRGLEGALGDAAARAYVRALREARYGWGPPPVGHRGRWAVRRALRPRLHSEGWTTSTSSTAGAASSSSARTSTRP